MMKRKFILMALCVSLSVSYATAQDLKSLLTGVAQTLVGDQTTTAESIVGTWTFVGPDCQFESDNLLAQAGGVAAAQQIEEKLDPVYEKLGLEGAQYVFNTDSTFSFTMGSKSSTGTYSFNSETKRLTMKTKLGVSMTANVTVTGSTMSLTFNADKLIDVLKTLTSLTAQAGSSTSLVNSLVSNYDGLLLGFELQKQ